MNVGFPPTARASRNAAGPEDSRVNVYDGRGRPAAQGRHGEHVYNLRRVAGPRLPVPDDSVLLQGVPGGRLEAARPQGGLQEDPGGAGGGGEAERGKIGVFLVQITTSTDKEEVGHKGPCELSHRGGGRRGD